MAEQARVSSVEALDAFRADLIVFLGRAHVLVDEVAAEVRRTKLWIQNDQRLHWEAEIRRRRRILDQAQQELLSARLSTLRDNLMGPMAAVRKAQAAFDGAEAKLRNVKRWARDYDSCIEPRLRNLESLRGILDHQLPAAISFLRETGNILEAYTGTARPAPKTASEPIPVDNGERPPSE